MRVVKIYSLLYLINVYRYDTITKKFELTGINFFINYFLKVNTHINVTKKYTKNYRKRCTLGRKILLNLFK